MGYQSKKSGLAGSWIKETSFIGELEKIIPGNVIKSNPDLAYKLRDAILNSYVVIDKADILKDISQTISLVFPEVKRGDLITAELVNKIMRAIENLDERVKVLESSGESPGAPVITGLSYSEPLRIGDRLTVEGRNFDVPAINNTVKVEGIKITDFGLSSSNNQLVFVVPDIPGIPPQGAPVSIDVSNPRGSDSTSVKVYPLLSIPQGRLEVVYFYPPVVPDGEQNIKAGEYIFTFSVTAFVDMDSTYTLNPSIVGNGAWKAELLKNFGDLPREDNQIEIPGNINGAQRFIRVRVTVPDEPPNTIGTLNLLVTENTPGTKVTPGHELIEIKIGDPPPTPEIRARVTLKSASNAARIIGNKVQFARDSIKGTIKFNILFMEGGAYEVASSLSNPTGWSEAEIDFPRFNVDPPASGEITNKYINVKFKANHAASDTDLIFSVIRVDSEISVKYVLGLTVE